MLTNEFRNLSAKRRHFTPSTRFEGEVVACHKGQVFCPLVELQWDFGANSAPYYPNMLLFLKEFLFDRVTPSSKLMLAVAVQLIGGDAFTARDSRAQF